MRVRALGLAGLLLFVASAALQAQGGRPVARAEVYAGSEVETYLRNLQVAGVVPSYPWGARRFTGSEVDRLLPADSAHPWGRRFDWRPSRGLALAVARPEVAARVNSGFPFGYNDGAVWAGRGVTASIQGGLAVRLGPFAATVVPVASWTSNAGVTLKPTGLEGPQRFADGFHPIGVDHPQRFGDRPFAIREWGQTTLEAVRYGVAVGVTTANEYWGPAAEFPLVLGNNAGGFPHLFLGTSRPVDLRAVRVHVRTLFGRLAQSAYSPQGDPFASRRAAGAVVIFVPRWPDGFEVGVVRFIQGHWASRRSPLTELVSPFRLGKLDRGAADDSLRNNLATVFVRWAIQSAGVEVYGEVGTEDYRYDIREVLVEPDHVMGYTVGMRQAKPLPGGRLRVIRAEIQNTQAATLVQDGATREGGFYTHAGLRQGHTVRGQLLGSEWGLGGGAAKVVVEMYRPTGRWTLTWSRLLRGEAALPAVASVPAAPRGWDVLYTIGLEGLFFRGRFDITVGGTAVYEVDRDFRRDAFNANAVVAIRAGIP